MRIKRLLTVNFLVAGIVACTTAGQPNFSGMTFSEEPLIGKFIWYDLITEDIDAARRFYGGMFGWKFEDSTGSRDHKYILAKSGNVYVAGLVAVASPADGSRISRWLPFISVDDVDRAVERSAAASANIAVPPRDVNLGRVAAIVDPQGAAIGLARSAIGDPDDATTAGGPGRVVWTELLADDSEAAADFYQSVVGFDVKTIQRRGGEYILLQKLGQERAGILQNPTEDWAPVWLTHFGVVDPAAAAAEAEALGGTVLLAPSPEVREGTIAVVTDPAGAVLVLHQWSS